MKKLKIANDVDFESLIDRIETDGESIILVGKDGEPVAVIMPYEDYEDYEETKKKGELRGW